MLATVLVLADVPAAVLAVVLVVCSAWCST
jgi:hypothetical protein